MKYYVQVPLTLTKDDFERIVVPAMEASKLNRSALVREAVVQFAKSLGINQESGIKSYETAHNVIGVDEYTDGLLTKEARCKGVSKARVAEVAIQWYVAHGEKINAWMKTDAPNATIQQGQTTVQ